MNIIITSIIVLGVIGCVAAVILYFVAKQFKVVEDERIEQIVAVLPGANCGGCGYPGCHGFAEACVKGDTLDGKFCPVGAKPVMEKVGAIMGMEVSDVEPKLAVVRCAGTCANRPKTNTYDGARNCRIAASHYAGDTGCGFGCFGFGDCQAVCASDAITINPETGIVEVDEQKCGGCGACVRACPRSVLELRPRGLKGRRVYVSCINKDKGAVARKACKVACIGCGKCAKVCPFEAITVENNVAYIDPEKCKACRKCVVECPQGSIKDVNFPTPAVKPAPKPAQPKAEAPKPEAKPEAPKTEAPKTEPQPQPQPQAEGEQKPEIKEQSLFS